jgi:glyoxylase-like metal-dependent hydrolase (beta-lactamase superfamily II)
VFKSTGLARRGSSGEYSAVPASKVHSLSIGEFRVIALPDGYADLQGWPVPSDPPPQPPVDWAAYHAAYPTGFHGESHAWRIHNTCYAIETPAHRILADCGVGVGPYPRYGNLKGDMPRHLAAAGLGFDDFDFVFFTHAHPDHVGWAFDEDAGRPRFRNARYLLARKDWDHFRGRETVPPYFRRFIQPLFDAGVLELLDGERDIAPGLTALETPGHTPGSMSLLARSGGAGFVVAGDVLNSPMFIDEPQRPFGSDADIPLGIRTRSRLVDRVEAEGWHVSAAHFPEPGWGNVVRVDGRRTFRAG